MVTAEAGSLSRKAALQLQQGTESRQKREALFSALLKTEFVMLSNSLRPNLEQAVVVITSQHAGHQMLRGQDRLFWMSKSVRNRVNDDNAGLCSITGSVLPTALAFFI